jgi:hypothetical protein
VVGSCASAEGINEQMQGDDGIVSCVFVHCTGIYSSFICLEACFGGSSTFLVRSAIELPLIPRKHCDLQSGKPSVCW